MEIRKRWKQTTNNDHHHAPLLPRPWLLVPWPLPSPAAAASALLIGAPFPKLALLPSLSSHPARNAQSSFPPVVGTVRV